MAASEMARWVRAFLRSRRPGSDGMRQDYTELKIALGLLMLSVWTDVEVIVVGAGPTGLMLAAELALAGVGGDRAGAAGRAERAVPRGRGEPAHRGGAGHAAGCSTR